MPTELPLADEPRCETCRFVNNIDHPETPRDEATFFCHRFPPKVDQDSKDTSLHPLVQWYNWCGEWQANGPPSKADEKFSSSEWIGLALSARAANAVNRSLRTKGLLSGWDDTFSASDAAKLTATDLLAEKHCGETTVYAIRKWLKGYGLKLRGER